MSYDDSDLATDLNRARFWLGDTSNDDATELLTDDFIEGALSIASSFDAAIALMATGLASRFAQQPGSVTLPSGLSVSWATRVSTWLSLAQLARTGQLTGAGAFSVVSPRADGYSTATTDEFGRPAHLWPPH